MRDSNPLPAVYEHTSGVRAHRAHARPSPQRTRSATSDRGSREVTRWIGTERKGADLPFGGAHRRRLDRGHAAERAVEVEDHEQRRREYERGEAQERPTHARADTPVGERRRGRDGDGNGADQERSDSWYLRVLEHDLRFLTGRLLACEVTRSRMRASVIGPLSDEAREKLGV